MLLLYFPLLYLTHGLMFLQKKSNGLIFLYPT
jgi:hypothetical protein